MSTKPWLFLLLGSSVCSAQVQIDSFQASGNGCPSGTYSWILSEDKQTLQILFNAFIAQKPGQPVRTCSIAMRVMIPPGKAITWYRTEHRGFVDTSGGATGEFWARYFVQGAGAFEREKLLEWQPHITDYFSVFYDNPQNTWSHCGEAKRIGVQTQIRLKGGGNGYISIDDQTNRAETILQFAYKSC